MTTAYTLTLTQLTLTQPGFVSGTFPLNIHAWRYLEDHFNGVGRFYHAVTRMLLMNSFVRDF